MKSYKDKLSNPSTTGVFPGGATVGLGTGFEPAGSGGGTLDVGGAVLGP